MAMKFPFKLPFLRKEEFREDKPRSGLLSKLYLTQKQRLQLLKWALYALVLVVLSVVQDVLLSRFSIFGTTTELVPCGIFLIVVAEGMETGSVFSLIAACCYLFSGSAAGNYVTIDHRDGFKSIYMHLSGFSISSGTMVSAGQQIGLTGSTGVSTGDHLHFGISYNGAYVNPCQYVGLY